jgi:site-specific DNA-methyltransferase (adenine-specific)
MNTEYYPQPNICLYNADNLEVMKMLPDNSIDIICIDPPYLYLKGQKLERPFNEKLFFSECNRLLNSKGSLILFGRGVSLARWVVLLDEIGLKFKEEIVWDKQRITSPVLPIGRRHELVYIFQKEKAKINDVRVDFFEKHEYEPQKIVRTVERLATTFGNRKTFDLLKKYFENGHKEFYKSADSEYCVSRSRNSNINQNRTVVFAVGLEEGVKQQSIIKCVSDHYKTIHPTQKPVKLLKSLIALTAPADKEKTEIVVADFFGGSMSCMEAVYEMGMKGISCEIDKEYFDRGKKRVESLPTRQITLFETPQL